MITRRITERVASIDGTAIAVDVVGSGPPLVLIGGAFSFRRWKGFLELATILSDAFTVYGYDRRGRGDSDTGPTTSVELEINDLAAVVDNAGNRPHLFGMSSGGVLGLRAVAAGLPARSVTVYQPPFVVDPAGRRPPADFGERLTSLIAQGRRRAAVHYFMTRGMGAPAPIVGLMRLAPVWRDLTAVAHTLPADHAVMGDTLRGRPLERQPWSRIATPTLVLDGGKSPRTVALAADQLSDRLPIGTRRTLAGQSHNISMAVLGAAIRDFAMSADSTRN